MHFQFDTTRELEGLLREQCNTTAWQCNDHGVSQAQDKSSSSSRRRLAQIEDMKINMSAQGKVARGGVLLLSQPRAAQLVAAASASRKFASVRTTKGCAREDPM